MSNRRYLPGAGRSILKSRRVPGFWFKPAVPFSQFSLFLRMLTVKRFLPMIAILFYCCNDAKKQGNESGKTDTAWTLLPFEKADQVNPVMIPDSSLVFNCPILRKEIQWARKDVFNPAAVTRNDTI